MRRRAMTWTIPFLIALEGFHVSADDLPTLDEARRQGRANSVLIGKSPRSIETADSAATDPRLDEFRARIAPALQNSCLACHGPEEQEAGFRNVAHVGDAIGSVPRPDWPSSSQGSRARRTSGTLNFAISMESLAVANQNPRHQKLEKLRKRLASS